MKAALIQMNPTVGALESNAARIADFAIKAASAGADIAIFPELVLTGYPPRDLLNKPDFIQDCAMTIKLLAAQIKGGIPIVIGHPEPRRAKTGRPLHNSCSILQNGKVKILHRKWLLPTYDVFDEDRYFEPGKTVSIEKISGINFGLSICEDIWNDKDFWSRPRYHRDPIEKLVEKGADFIVNISGSPYHQGKGSFREQMMGAAAKNYGRPVLFVNQVGGNDSLVFDGHSCAFDSSGKVIARAPEFVEHVLVVDLDRMKGKISEPYDCVESVRAALVLGLKDYVAKCRFKRVVVGLSGGIDSSLTAALAVEALGRENVIGVAMPSRYSSEGSRSDALELARRLGIRCDVVPIDEMHTAFLNVLKGSLGDIAHTLTEENIQARIRAIIIMSYSNHLGAMVLTTGNKSELAMGYCTLYGDMSGGLAVIADVPKALVYKVARLINDETDIIPPDVFTKAPSAELRPDQKDSDSLPEYDILDPILEAYIEENLAPSDIVARGFDRELVRRIVNTVDLNEYKRRQAAPGIRVTTKAFGEGRRLPIAQGYKSKI